MITFNFNKSIHVPFFLVLFFISGCSNQAVKSIDSEDYASSQAHDTASFKTLRHKRLSSRKQLNKQHFSENDLLWDRLFSLYALPEVDDPRVERELNWFLEHPDYIARVQQRAAPYLYQIVNEVEAQDIPGELALLPIVESAFKPEAVSSASAAGLWQFMPSTGKDFGLEQNWWYDGRHDIYASTQAAVSYLKELSELFDGDWLLALASYNYGRGNIQKALDHNDFLGQPIDFWSLHNLPSETMHYVPKLLAIAKLFAHAEEYHVRLNPIRNKAVFEIVDVGSPLYLAQAAAMAHTHTWQLQKLNPAFKQNATAPAGPHHLLIPVAHVETFKRNLERMPDEEKARVTQNIRNQEIEMLAAKRAAELEKIARSEAEKAAQKRLAEAKRLLARKIDSQHESIYTVKKHDTFLNVARRFGVNPNDLANWNNISPRTMVRIGQRLTIKSKASMIASSSNRNPFQTIRYLVKKGETLSAIARKFHVSVVDIRKWNAATLKNQLQAGQRLKVIIDSTQSVS